MFIAVIAIGMALVWAFGGDGEAAREGAQAPDFGVSLVAGGRFTLSDHIADDGRPRVINLWASWCAPCRDEIPTLSAFAVANPDLAVVGVAVEDTAEDSIRLAAELRPSYPLAHGARSSRSHTPTSGCRSPTSSTGMASS